MQETISTGQEVVLGKITRLATKNKDGWLQIPPQTIPSAILVMFFIQKFASPVATHPYQSR